MKETVQLKCTCAHCGHIIEYEPADVGQIIGCPQCGEESQLPTEPPAEEESSADRCPTCKAPLRPKLRTCPICESRRQTKRIVLAVGAVSVVGVLVVAAAFLFHPQARSSASSYDPFASNLNLGPLPQPKVRTAKSLDDLKVRAFTVRKQRDSQANLIVGDIENTSDNLHRSVIVQLDVLDSEGAKVGAAHETITELPPHYTWQVVIGNPGPKAATVRVVDLRENEPAR